MENVKISIIMPAYNASKYIGAAIESVLNQTYENWQLVIVDDGSTDDTLKIAEQYAAQDEENRIMVIHQANSGTAAAARNTALKYVNGTYVQVLDSDDYLSKDCLQKYITVMKEANNLPIIVLPIALSVLDDGTVIREISHVSKFIGQVISGEKAFELSLDWTIHGWMYVCTDLIKKIKFDPLLVNGDEFTTRKLFANAETIMFSDGVYYYRDNQESTTKSSKNRARMHEALITDGNIYKYSVEKRLSEELQKKSMQKWNRSLIAHKAQFLREAGQYKSTEYQYANEIIENALKEIVDLKDRTIDNSLWGKIVKWCSGKMSRLTLMARIYNILWKVKNIIRKR